MAKGELSEIPLEIVVTSDGTILCYDQKFLVF